MDTVAFVGKLRAVDLDTHRLQVTDDTGTKVALAKVVDSETIGRLLNQYVAVFGTPVRDDNGNLKAIHGARVEPALALPQGVGLGVQGWVSLGALAEGLVGPSLRGIPDVTDDEAESFLTAIGLRSSWELSCTGMLPASITDNGSDVPTQAGKSQRTSK